MHEDTEKNLVESIRQYGLHISPDDMTNDCLQGGRSTGQSNNFVKARMLLSDAWSFTLKPHYNNAHEAIHRIADVRSPRACMGGFFFGFFFFANVGLGSYHSPIERRRSYTSRSEAI